MSIDQTTIDAHGFTIAVEQSFGNCPQYIQRRTIADVDGMRATPVETLDALDEAARAMIARADTLFVASRSRASALRYPRILTPSWSTDPGNCI